MEKELYPNFKIALIRLLVWIYKQSIIEGYLKEQLLMVNCIQYLVKMVIVYGLINMGYIVDILHLYIIHLYFYKYLILFVVEKYMMKLISFIISAPVKYFGLLLDVLLGYKDLLLDLEAGFFKCIALMDLVRYSGLLVWELEPLPFLLVLYLECYLFLKYKRTNILENQVKGLTKKQDIMNQQDDMFYDIFSYFKLLYISYYIIKYNTNNLFVIKFYDRKKLYC
jgi:hypothetical protein